MVVMEGFIFWRSTAASNFQKMERSGRGFVNGPMLLPNGIVFGGPDLRINTMKRFLSLVSVANSLDILPISQ
jgi:hypothetical protein